MTPAQRRHYSEAEVIAIITRHMDWPPPPRPIVNPLGFGPDEYLLKPYFLFGIGREETSDNWSGIGIAADAGEAFDAITCKIKIPYLVPPVSPALSAPPAGSPGKVPNALAVSTWIGFDGLLGTSNSMPQIGITQSFTWKPNSTGVSGTWQLAINAWWQWWLRGQTTPVNAVTLTVNEGDTVSLTLTRTSPFTATGVMVNGAHSSGPIHLYPDPTNGPGPSLGRTAEWIAERPMKPMKYLPPKPNPDLWCKLYPLPKFDWVEFSDCQASANSTDGAGIATVRGTLPSRCLRMVEAKLSPSRSVIHSRAMVDGPNSFRVGPDVGRTWPPP
jgi:hypothetical protein